MTRQFKSTGLGILALACVPHVATAQNIITRTTNMNWEALYGGGPNSFSPSDTFTSTTLESSFSKNMSFADSQAGDYPLPWNATVAINFDQSFNITGPLNDFAMISAQMQGSKSQSAGGNIGIAGIGSVLPGNELLFEFTVGGTMQYRLQGSWSSTVANSSWVALAKFNGVSYGGVHDTRQLFLGTTGTFDWTGTLDSGQYILVSQNELNNGNSVFVGENTYTFTNLDAVPEPLTLVALGGLALIAQRRKKAPN